MHKIHWESIQINKAQFPHMNLKLIFLMLIFGGSPPPPPENLALSLPKRGATQENFTFSTSLLAKNIFKIYSTPLKFQQQWGRNYAKTF